jgi:hypothetical protein
MPRGRPKKQDVKEETNPLLGKVEQKKGGVIGERSSLNKVENIYNKIPERFLNKTENPNFHLHKLKLPFRMLIVSYSGGGKTNFLANLLALFSQGKGTFSKIFIITRNKDEAIYNYLEDITEGQIVIKEGIENLPNLDEKTFDKTENSLVVFDDLVLNKNQERIEQYFIRCRKLGVSAIYISQSYYRTPKIIRGNVNYLVLLKIGSARDLRLILSEVAIGVTKEQLEKMYKYATQEQFQVFLIDNDAPIEEKYRKNYLEILDPNNFM